MKWQKKKKQKRDEKRRKKFRQLFLSWPQICTSVFVHYRNLWLGIIFIPFVFLSFVTVAISMESNRHTETHFANSILLKCFKKERNIYSMWHLFSILYWYFWVAVLWKVNFQEEGNVNSNLDVKVIFFSVGVWMLMTEYLLEFGKSCIKF